MAKDEKTAPKRDVVNVNGFEKWLAGVYKNTPSLPSGARTWLANNVYWLALIGGIVGLFTVFGLWQTLQNVSNFLYSTGTFSVMYGGDYRMVVWITLITSLAQSVLLLMAYSGLKAHRKSGWNLLFYTGLLSIFTIVAYLFSAAYGLGSALGSLLGVAISYYFLFQIRDHFTKA